MLETLLLSAALGGQLCYDHHQDIGDHRWLKSASIYEEPLTIAVRNKVNVCLAIENQPQLDEANKLVDLDASKKTISIR